MCQRYSGFVVVCRRRFDDVYVSRRESEAEEDAIRSEQRMRKSAIGAP
jgi:hypothetical protein